MSNEMTEAEFWAALAPVTQPQPVSYRLYHDDLGQPLFYSMEDVPGNYIEIDRDTYLNPPTRVRVVDGKIKSVSDYQSQKLVPADKGACCTPSDVCVVVDHTQPHTAWKMKTYEAS